VIIERTDVDLEVLELQPLRSLTRGLMMQGRFTFDQIAQLADIGRAYGLTGGQRVARAWAGRF